MATFLACVIFYCLSSLLKCEGVVVVAKVKEIHVMLKEQIFCLHTNTNENFVHMNDYTNYEMNVALLFQDHKHNIYQQKLQSNDKCSDNLMGDSVFNQHTFFCGVFANILPWAKTFERNFQQYSELKVNAVHGAITFTSEQNDMIIYLQKATHVNIIVNLHGFDPCRVAPVREEKCENSCFPSCKLYATGFGKLKCGKQEKSYNMVKPYKEENYTGTFNFQVEQIHRDKEGINCIQMTTNAGSHCYVDSFEKVLVLENKETNEQISLLNASSECTPLFFKKDYSGSFCFKISDALKNKTLSFHPKSLELNNLVLYCDHFSVQLTSMKNISLEAIRTEHYNMLKLYDICPHALKEKGEGYRKHPALKIDKGFLVESDISFNTAATQFSFATVSAIVLVIIFIIAGITSILLYRANKNGKYFVA